MITKDSNSSVVFNYRAPKLGATSTLGLVNLLLARVPARAPANVQTAVKKLKKRRDALETAWTLRERSQRPALVRPAVLTARNAWGALSDRLTASTRLPVDQYPMAARAKEILGAVFAGGLEFLTLESTGIWAESDRRLKNMREDGMVHDIERIAGSDFLAYVTQAHADLATALGIGTRPEPQAQGDAVGVALRAVNEAIAGYGLRVVAMYDPDEDADGSVLQAVREALKPLDVMREKAARSSTASADDGSEADASTGTTVVSTETAIVPAAH